MPYQILIYDTASQAAPTVFDVKEETGKEFHFIAYELSGTDYKRGVPDSVHGCKVYLGNTYKSTITRTKKYNIILTVFNFIKILIY